MRKVGQKWCFNFSNETFNPGMGIKRPLAKVNGGEQKRLEDGGEGQRRGGRDEWETAEREKRLALRYAAPLPQDVNWLFAKALVYGRLEI